MLCKCRKTATVAVIPTGAKLVNSYKRINESAGKIMDTRNVLASTRMLAMALLASLFVAACGGSSSEPANTQAVQPTTGTVVLLFTDKPTEEFSSIVLEVSEATLIGDDDSQHVLFTSEPGEERFIDLLDLTNYNEPVMFGEVQVGTYTKIRLQLESIELFPMDGSDPFFIPNLPANGKVDLLHPEGFDILPGRTVMVEVDVDANKAIKITRAGNSGRVNFRPVVRVNIYDGGMPHKLARLEGAIVGDPNATDGTFVLCSIDAPDYCVDVATDAMTSFFNDEGFDTDFGYLADGNMVVVIGEYGTDPIVLNAIVVETGPDVGQITGDVVSRPMDGEFLVLTILGEDFVVELQSGTKFYDADGPIAADLIALADRVEVEGVIPPKADEADPDVIRAALVFLESNDDDEISGTIIDPIVDTEEEQSFVLMTETGDVQVCVSDTTSILLVDDTNSEVTTASFADLAVDQVVDVFGMMPEGEGCFEANEVIVDVPPPAAE